MANDQNSSDTANNPHPTMKRKSSAKIVIRPMKLSNRGKGISTVLRILDAIRKAAPNSLDELQQVRRNEVVAIAEERKVKDGAITDICWRYTNSDGKVREFDKLVWRWLNDADNDLKERLRVNSKNAGDHQKIIDFFESRSEAEEIGHFTRDTFDTLKALETSPTVETYIGIKDKVHETVIGALKSLFADVTAKLPDNMKGILETKKNLFSRIRKNDFGKGGVNPNFWGAYTLKGRKRTTSAQLFVFVYSGGIEFGFYMGQDSDESLIRLFGRRCSENIGIVQQALTPLLEDGDFYLSIEEGRGNPGSNMEVDQWIKQGAKKNYRACVWLSPEDLWRVDHDLLSTYILITFRALFPLMLLTHEDNQLEAIKSHLAGQPEPSSPLHPAYTLTDIEKETLVSAEDLHRWVRAINRKGQAIFYGPPGTGKTYIAQRLAKHLIADGDGFMELVQFHPSYAYEDFMEGIRPLAIGGQSKEATEKEEADSTEDEAPLPKGFYYDMVPGRFLAFCDKARKRQGPCVLIIDEINRAELSRVFGELMYLLEYRSLVSKSERATEIASIPLAGGRRFSVPANVRIIGTMNTADRSIALVDHALRRRFSFISIPPNYDLLQRFHKDTGFPAPALIKWLGKINLAIGDPHYAIGVSFFLKPDLAEHIKDIWELEIEPYLEEYFFDRRDSFEGFRWNKVQADIGNSAPRSVSNLTLPNSIDNASVDPIEQTSRPFSVTDLANDIEDEEIVEDNDADE